MDTAIMDQRRQKRVAREMPHGVLGEELAAEWRLREAQGGERCFYELVQGVDAIVWEADAASLVFTFVNQRAQMLGYPVELWYDDPGFWTNLIHPQDRERTIRSRREATAQGLDHVLEYRAVAADRRVVWLHDTVRIVLDKKGRVQQLRGVMLDISTHKHVQAKLTHLVRHDALTGLPTHDLLQEQLSQELVYARGYRRFAAVLFLGLDRFKLFTDSVGHSIVNRLLQRIAERLRSCVREGDIVARLGDDFAIALKAMAHPGNASQIADTILERFAAPFHLDSGSGLQEFFVSLSLGISVYPTDSDDGSALIANARSAMHRSRRLGGNRYHFFEPEMNTAARKRWDLERALRNAVERQEFMLCYQPQVDATTGRTVGVEALLRWRRCDKSIISPDEFIPLLEDTGLIVPVGEWVLREACVQYQAWRKAGLPLKRVAVNVSPQQIRHARFVENLVRVLDDTGIDPRCLELETTESEVMREIEKSLEVLRRVRELGVRLSMDDFGTGYSSLNYLKLLPVDAVKIDRSFIRDIPGNENDVAIVRAVVALAHSLRLRVVAEGVETHEQLEFLKYHECEFVQGYFFSRPLPPNELASFIAIRAT